MKDLLYLKKYFFRYRWRLLLGMLFVIGANIFKIWQPRLIRQGLDYVIAQLKANQGGGVLTPETNTALMRFGLLIIGAAMMSGLFMYAMRRTIIVVSRLIEYDMRRDILAHYFGLDLAFFKRHAVGDLMARISEDVSQVRMFLGPVVLYSINVSFLIVFVVYSMLKVSPALSFYALLPLPVLAVSIYFVGNLINLKSKRIAEMTSRLNALAQETFSGIRVVKSFAIEDRIAGYFDEESEAFQKKSLELARVNALFRPMMSLLIGISTVLTVYKGGLLVAAGEITTGNIAEFVIYVNMLSWPVTSLGWMASITQQAAASQRRINEYLRHQPSIRSGGYIPEVFRGRIEFDNVGFTYPDTGIQALDKVSFVIKAGEITGITGEIGSGKTTVAELLLRMYDIDDGQILLDNVDIREYDLRFLRKQIGYTPQVSFLFSDTVANNIRFGKEDATDDELIQMSRNVAILEDINALPQGFESLVGERGVTLSGGQKQRVAMARALLKQPQILIFDDSLSALDSNTEEHIMEYLAHSLTGKTMLIITHRISPKVKYDRILVFEKGKIIQIIAPAAL